MSEFLGTVYLIHFDRPFSGVRHYVGFAVSVTKRMYHHNNGTGSKLLAAVRAAGIGFQVVRRFDNVSREIERNIKNYKSTKRFCPECSKNAPWSLVTPKGYTEPAKRPARAYKWTSGEIPAVSAITITPATLYPRLAKRVRVGEKIQVDKKILIRQDRRKFKNYFSEYFEQIEIADVIDESVEMTREIYTHLLNRDFTETRRSDVCRCGHGSDWHDWPDGGDETGRAPCDYVDGDGRQCLCDDYTDPDEPGATWIDDPIVVLDGMILDDRDDEEIPF